MVRPIKTYHLYLLLSTLATVWGCRKDVEEFRPYTPVLEDIGQLFSQVPGSTTHTVFQFGGSIPDTTLTTASGVRVFLADTENLFADDTGTPVPCSTCPSLKIEVTSVLTKGDILSRELPTTAFPDAQMLESAGIVEVRASCNGKPLQLRSNPDRYIKIQIPAADVADDMQVYTGSLNASDKLEGWTGTGKPVFLAQWPLPGSGVIQPGYELLATQLGWTNCAHPLIEQSSPFCVTLPDQFTALNARVFLVFQNRRAVAELKGDDASSEFCFPAAPIGYPVRVIVLGKTGDQYWLSNHFTEIGTNVMMPLTPQPQEEQDLLNFLKNL